MSSWSIRWQSWLAIATGAIVTVASFTATLKALMPPSPRELTPTAAQNARNAAAAASAR